MYEVSIRVEVVHCFKKALNRSLKANKHKNDNDIHMKFYINGIFNHQRAAMMLGGHIFVQRSFKCRQWWLILVCMPGCDCLDLDLEVVRTNISLEGESRPLDLQPSKDALHTHSKCRRTRTKYNTPSFPLQLRWSVITHFAEVSVSLITATSRAQIGSFTAEIVWGLGLVIYSSVSSFICFVPHHQQQPFIVLVIYTREVLQWNPKKHSCPWLNVNSYIFSHTEFQPQSDHIFKYTVFVTSRTSDTIGHC